MDTLRQKHSAVLDLVTTLLGETDKRLSAELIFLFSGLKKSKKKIAAAPHIKTVKPSPLSQSGKNKEKPIRQFSESSVV